MSFSGSIYNWSPVVWSGYLLVYGFNLKYCFWTLKLLRGTATRECWNVVIYKVIDSFIRVSRIPVREQGLLFVQI